MKLSTLAQVLALFAVSATASPIDAPNLAKPEEAADPTEVDAQMFWPMKTKTVYTTVACDEVTVTKTKTGSPAFVTITGKPEVVYTTVHGKKPYEKEKREEEEDAEVDAQMFWMKKKKTVTVTITAPPVTKTEYVKVPGGTITTKVPGGTITKTVTKGKKH